MGIPTLYVLPCKDVVKLKMHLHTVVYPLNCFLGLIFNYLVSYKFDRNLVHLLTSTSESFIHSALEATLSRLSGGGP